MGSAHPPTSRRRDICPRTPHASPRPAGRRGSQHCATGLPPGRSAVRWERVIEVVQQGFPLLVLRGLAKTHLVVLQGGPAHQQHIVVWPLDPTLPIAAGLDANGSRNFLILKEILVFCLSFVNFESLIFGGFVVRARTVEGGAVERCFDQRGGDWSPSHEQMLTAPHRSHGEPCRRTSTSENLGRPGRCVRHSCARRGPAMDHGAGESCGAHGPAGPLRCGACPFATGPCATLSNTM